MKIHLCQAKNENFITLLFFETFIFIDLFRLLNIISLMVQKLEERRLLTIVFSEFTGFAALASELEPEEVSDVANTCLEYLNKPIIGEGGTVHKHEGSLVISLFGISSIHEDDPEHAVKAALDMIQLLPGLNEALSAKLRKRTDIGLQIGINSGIVFVGEVGTKEKTEYTVMGDVVNLASRLKDTAKKGEIIVSESIFRSSRYLVDYEPLPSIKLKGIKEDVRIFKALQIKKNPDPKRGIKGLQAPMLGRDKELGILQDAVSRLNDGMGGVFFIQGDAGLGKSRLVAELKKSIIEGAIPVTILEGRCSPNVDARLYMPFIEIINYLFQINKDDDNKTIGEKFVKECQRLLPMNWKDIVPYIGHVLAIHLPDELEEKVKHLDAKTLKTQIQLAFRKLLVIHAQLQPLLIIIEDYQWIDNESRGLLEFIFNPAEELPMLLMALTRIEKEHECFRTIEKFKKQFGDYYTEIILQPLDTNVVDQLIQHLLQIIKIGSELRAEILTKAAGNPFYLEEIIRALIDARILTFKDGFWILNPDTPLPRRIEVPDTVQSVIISRLDHLDGEVKNILEMASVVGRKFYSRILEQICSIDSLMLTLHLATLEDYEYIIELRRQPESEYTFRHPVLHEITYNGLLKSRRRELHRRIGKTIEELYGNNLDEWVELLARQYSQSDSPYLALKWLKVMAEKATELFANDEAINHYKEIVGIIKNGTKKEVDADQLLLDAYEKLGDIYSLKGYNHEAKRYYEELYNNAGKDSVRKAKSKRKIAKTHQILGENDNAIKLLEEAEEILPTDTPSEICEKAEIRFLRGQTLGFKGDYREAIQLVESALAMVESDKIDQSEKQVIHLKCTIYGGLGMLHYNLGEYDRTIELLNKSLAISEEFGFKRGSATIANNLGIIYTTKCDYAKSAEQFEKYLNISEEIGYKQGIGIASNNLALNYMLWSDYDRALSLLQKYLEISEEMSSKRGICSANGNIGQLYHYLGDFTKARDYFQKELKIAEQNGFKDLQARSLVNFALFLMDNEEYELAKTYLLKAQVIYKQIGEKSGISSTNAHMARLLAIEKPDSKEIDPEALSYAEESLQIADKIKNRPTQIRANLALAKVYAAANKFEQAEPYFKKVIASYDEFKFKRLFADVCFDYAIMLKKGHGVGIYSIESVNEYLNKARAIYQELKLNHKIKEVENFQNG